MDNRIYQNRPDIFARQIILPTMLYEQVIEVSERYDAHGNELAPVNREQVKSDLEKVYHTGIRSCAIAFIHSDRYPHHEQQVAQVAQEVGFTQISVSYQVSPYFFTLTLEFFLLMEWDWLMSERQKSQGYNNFSLQN
jgi:5-oxoprolinase (ATP-hydrolysing)